MKRVNPVEGVEDALSDNEREVRDWLISVRRARFG
jgi:hypothetical protein